MTELKVLSGLDCFDFERGKKVSVKDEKMDIRHALMIIATTDGDHLPVVAPCFLTTWSGSLRTGVVGKLTE